MCEFRRPSIISDYIKIIWQILRIHANRIETRKSVRRCQFQTSCCSHPPTPCRYINGLKGQAPSCSTSGIFRPTFTWYAGATTALQTRCSQPENKHKKNCSSFRGGDEFPGKVFNVPWTVNVRWIHRACALSHRKNNFLCFPLCFLHLGQYSYKIKISVRPSVRPCVAYVCVCVVCVCVCVCVWMCVSQLDG